MFYYVVYTTLHLFLELKKYTNADGINKIDFESQAYYYLGTYYYLSTYYYLGTYYYMGIITMVT